MPNLLLMTPTRTIMKVSKTSIVERQSAYNFSDHGRESPHLKDQIHLAVNSTGWFLIVRRPIVARDVKNEAATTGVERDCETT